MVTDVNGMVGRAGLFSVVDLGSAAEVRAIDLEVEIPELAAGRYR
jgi:hypothetical protein